DNLAGAARIHKERKWVRAARCLRNKIGGEKLKGLGGWVGWNPTIAERPCCLAHCLIIVEPANQLEDRAACPWQQRLEWFHDGKEVDVSPVHRTHPPHE